MEPEWDKPIFIVGAPRSGTTLLRNLLNRHPAIAICRETHFSNFIYRRRRSFGNLAEARNRKRLAKEYLSIQRLQRMNMDLEALQSTLILEGVSYPAFFASLLRFYARSQGKRRCGEKTPQHALFVPTLLQWYPGACILHLVRDPRDVVASLLHMPWAPKSVIGNARLWSHFNRSVLRSQAYPRYRMIRYEQLAANPEQELSQICEFLGEEYSPAMLTPDRSLSPERPWFRRAEGPVTPQRIEKWREELTNEDVALVEWLVGSQMQELGYELAAGAPTLLARVRGLASAVFDAVRRRLGEFPGGWYYITRSTQLAKEEAAKQRYYDRRRARAAATGIPKD
jgi:hypothetical protein